MENPAYQRVYNVGLLDDIHNYFPALLYEHTRFQTLSSIFSYVRHQMNTRFNLYSYGASLAGAREAPVQEDLSDLATVNLLLSLMQPGFIPASRIPRRRTQTGEEDLWTAFRSPIVVSPSVEIIAANTEIIIGSDISSNIVCSICQEMITGTESCRRIIACQHVYHRVCIDQWFGRSVFCPSCRHDIRIASPRLHTASQPSLRSQAPLEAQAQAQAQAPLDETLFQELGYQ